MNTISARLFFLAKTITIVVAILAITLAFIFYYFDDSRRPSPKTVAITQIVQHQSLDLIRKGIIDQLQAEGFINDKNIKIIFENAQGNIATTSQIAQKFVGLSPDVIVAISTPSAQAIHAAIRDTDIPLVFSAVTDPVAAGLINAIDKPGRQVTGTVDFPPIEDQIKLLKKLVHNLKSIGVIYNPGEINSVRQIEQLQAIARQHGIQVIKSPAVRGTEVYGATSRLAEIVEAIYLPNDNAVVSALDSVLRVAKEKRIPTIASEDQSTQRGALVGLANDQYEVGRDTGKIVARILRKEKPENIPILITKKVKLTINKETAKDLNIDIDGIESKTEKRDT